MPSDNVLSAGAATAVLGIWWAIDAFPRHRAIPSRDSDKGSLLALNVAHGFQLVGMLVGFLGVGRIDGADAPLQLSGLGLMVAGIAVRWTAIHALGGFFTGRVQIQEGHTLIRTGLIRDFVILRMPALCSLTAVSDWPSRTGGRWHAVFCRISSRLPIGSTLRRPSFTRRSDRPTHNTRGRQSASFPGCTEAQPDNGVPVSSRLVFRKTP